MDEPQPMGPPIELIVKHRRAERMEQVAKLLEGCEVKPRWIMLPPGWEVQITEPDLPEYVI